MAIADSIPGVSGGTIAFILGFYDQLIISINNLIKGPNEKRIQSLKFLMKLGVGWIIGIVLSILFIASVFEENIYQISSLFAGLVIASIPQIILQEKDTLKEKYNEIIFVTMGILIVIAITFFNPFTDSASFALNSWVQYLVIILAGMIAISAMILPGISGSTILLILGVYHFMILSVNNLIHFDFSALLVVIPFGFGILLGLFFTIRGVNYAFKHHRSKTIFTILGLMIGSVYAIMQGPKSIATGNESLNLSNFSILFFIIGVGVIIGLERLKKHIEKV